MLLWAIWLAASFAVFLAIELWTRATGRPTLSRFFWNWQKAWPFLSFVFGLAFGALAMHFFGWNPSCK